MLLNIMMRRKNFTRTLQAQPVKLKSVLLLFLVVGLGCGKFCALFDDARIYKIALHRFGGLNALGYPILGLLNIDIDLGRDL